MANLYNNGIDQAIDGNGNVYPGAKRYFYDNGTTTLRTIWQDKAKTATHANPVVADSNGVFPAIWIEGVYSSRLEDSAGALIPQEGATQDDVNSTTTSILTSLASSGTSLSNIDYDEASSSGLSFAYTAGRIDDKDGTVSSVAASSLTLPASQTNYIYLDYRTNAVVQSTTAGREASKLLYTVTTDGGSITAVVNEKEAFNRQDQFPPDYIKGLTVSIGTDTDHDVDIAVGYARDSSDAIDLNLTAAITKQIDANWAAGDNAGGMPAGLLATSTTYYIFLIIDSADGTVDAGFDTSATATNLLSSSSYTHYIEIGTFDTDGSSNIDSATFFNTSATIKGFSEGASGAPKIQPKAFASSGSAIEPLVLLQTDSVSGSPGTINFEPSNPENYSEFVIRFSALEPTTAADIVLTPGTSGAYASGSVFQDGNTTRAVGWTLGASVSSLIRTDGYIRIFNHARSVPTCALIQTISYNESTQAYSSHVDQVSYLIGTGVHTRFRFDTTAGLFSNVGTIEWYGRYAL